MALCARHGVTLSGLGYCPNPLTADEREAEVCIGHLKKVITAAALLGVNQVNTFIGRDPARAPADNWRVFDERWPGIVRHAEAAGVRIGIENCRCTSPIRADRRQEPRGLAAHLAGDVPAHPEPRARPGLRPVPHGLAARDPIAPLREFADRIYQPARQGREGGPPTD